MDIDDILRSIQAGERQAFAEVVRRFQRPLFAFLGNMGLTQGQAEELAQETFLRAWSRIGQYRSELGMFSTWLFSIARNLALNEMERPASRHEVAVEEDAPTQACERPTPHDALAQAQRRRILHAAMARLSNADRCLLALAYLQEMDVAAIAQIEGCTTGAVKTRLHRARARLSELLEKDHV